MVMAAVVAWMIVLWLSGGGRMRGSRVSIKASSLHSVGKKLKCADFQTWSTRSIHLRFLVTT